MTNKETYPGPGNPLARPRPSANPEYGHSREDWEERVFRRAGHFNVVRYGTHNGSEILTCSSFAKAAYVALEQKRALIYAVCSETGEAFCLPLKELGKYAEIWLEMASAQKEH